MFALAALLALAAPGPARAQGGAQTPERITFGLDWVAQAEYGGYYQAVATGLYARRGLQVTIRQGGPQVNHMQLMIAGQIDFNLAGGRAIEFAAEGLPYLAVAAMYQKEPAVLIAHPNMGNDSFEALVGKPIAIGADTRAGWWRFLAARFGYTESQIRPYTFNMAPFLVDRNAIQQGFLTSEPFVIERAGAKPKVFLLADLGYDNYQTTIEAPRKLTDERPDFVQKFVDASILGWYSYLFEDPTPGNLLIKRDNPDMDDEKIANSIKLMKEFGIVDGGDAKTLGIGAMSDERWQRFGQSMIEAGLYEANLDIKQAYTTRFVNKRTGM